MARLPELIALDLRCLGQLVASEPLGHRACRQPMELAPLARWMSRATPEAIAAYSQRIAGAWTGTFGQYTVTTQVTTPAPETPRSQYNVVDISPLARNATNGTPFTNAVGGSYINVAPLTTGSNPVNEYNLNRADAYNLWAAGHERDMPWASRTCTATQLNVRFLATKQISWQCLKACQKH